jgi:hypothetical protein
MAKGVVLGSLLGATALATFLLRWTRGQVVTLRVGRGRPSVSLRRGRLRVALPRLGR